MYPAVLGGKNYLPYFFFLSNYFTQTFIKMKLKLFKVYINILTTPFKIKKKKLKTQKLLNLNILMYHYFFISFRLSFFIFVSIILSDFFCYIEILFCKYYGHSKKFESKF